MKRESGSSEHVMVHLCALKRTLTNYGSYRIVYEKGIQEFREDAYKEIIVAKKQ